ncbi:MAG: S-layer homology domain-containing protein [Thermoanaerobaculia bacterium]
MNRNLTSRLRRALGLSSVLVLTGAAVVHANTLTVPNGTVNGGAACSASNPNVARFSQSCGAQVGLTAGDTAPSYVQDSSPAGEGTYRARFYANLRTVQMADGEDFQVFEAYDGADPTPPANSGNAVVRLRVQQAAGGARQLVAVARLDSGNELTSPAFPLPNGWRSIEIDWAKATAAGANNGRLGLWIDGVARATGLTGLDNDTLAINYVRLGAVAGLGTTVSGTLRVDDFASQRTGYVGPALPFSDMPTSNSFFPFVQGIYANEIIPGCAVGSFCPDSPITRKEMAKFLLLSRYGNNYTPPACVTPLFTDVPCSNSYAAWVNEMARQGITGGCATGLFCPDGNVTRAQMSVFLMVTRGFPALACPPSSFNDVAATSSFCGWVKQIATQGITAGCGNGNFCPDTLVSRGQMSVFLSTTFGLPTEVVGP